jgi:hypothetical protein
MKRGWPHEPTRDSADNGAGSGCPRTACSRCLHSVGPDGVVPCGGVDDELLGDTGTGEVD